MESAKGIKRVRTSFSASFVSDSTPGVVVSGRVESAEYIVRVDEDVLSFCWEVREDQLHRLSEEKRCYGQPEVDALRNVHRVGQ